MEGLSTLPKSDVFATKRFAFAAAYFIPSPSALVFSARLLSTIRAKTMLHAVPIGVKTTVQHVSAPVYPVAMLSPQDKSRRPNQRRENTMM